MRVDVPLLLERFYFVLGLLCDLKKEDTDEKVFYFRISY
jgi:hypothetical protein